MFNRSTVFVVGAGASKEVGLPVGSGLAEKIGQALDIRLAHSYSDRAVSGDKELYSHLRHVFFKEIEEYQKAGWRIRDGIRLSHSIDDFLDIHRDDSRLNLVGKTAIVKSILEAERNSHLFNAGQNTEEIVRINSLDSTWFVKLMRMLGRSTSSLTARDALASLTFIVFNYDRCLEQFLVHALRRLYAITNADAFQIMKGIRIIHPYGFVDEIPDALGRGGTRFGGDPDRLSANYVQLSSKIRTYTEQVADEKLLTDIHEEVRKAECIVFLGFGYHKQNMQLLWPSEPMDNKFIFGTAYGMSAADVDVVSRQIAAQFKPNLQPGMHQNGIKIENKLSCADLFDHFALSLPG